MIVFVIIKNTDVCLVDHIFVALYVSGFPRVFYFVGDISCVIEFEQIRFIGAVDIRISGLTYIRLI